MISQSITPTYPFLIDVATDRIWIVDFQYIGVLPKPFQQHAFFSTSSLASNVGRSLGYQRPDVVVVKAASILKQLGGDGSFGRYSAPKEELKLFSLQNWISLASTVLPN